MHRRRSSVLIALAVIASLAAVPGTGEASATLGEWSQAFSENAAFNGVPAPQTEAETKDIPTAVSLVVLPDGNVAYWNGLQDTESMDAPIILAGGTDDQTSKSRHLKLRDYFATGELPTPDDFSVPTPDNGDGADLFCSDQRLLPDGRVLVVGGTVWVNESEQTTNGTPLEGLGQTELYGAKDARVYDYRTNEWSNVDVPDMAHGRWYPAMVTMADGKMLVAGGVERLGCNTQLCPGQAPPEFLLPQNVRETETYDPEANTWTANGDSISLPLYARLRLMPDGKVLYDTTGQAWGPFGEDQDQMGWGTPKVFDPQTREWSDVNAASPLDVLNFRSGSFSVMLPLKPPYTSAQILVGGGVMLPSPGAWVATNLSEILTFTNGPDVGSIVRTATGALNNARWFSSGVGLPTGEVIAFNGGDLDEVIFPGLEAAIKQAELFDPDTGTWTPLASTDRDRTYHNSAVLLKDGSVLIGGHSPIVAGYGQDHGTYRSNGFKDPTFEIYKPPYLFRGPRPTITSAPSTASQGDTITVGTPNADSENLKAVLVRLPGVTHVTDADQRTVELAHTDNGDGSIDVTIPASSSVVPGGHYYLFLVDDTGQGDVPSVAQIVTID